ncbi:MAG: hypothetical protein ACLGID_13910 [Gammaproteobacteria bacterium]
MNDTHRKRMQPRDCLYHHLNQGDDTDSATTETHQKALNLREQYSVSFDIALIAETQSEAQQLMDRILELPGTCFPESVNYFDRHRFSAHGLDLPWPERQFDELHLLCSSPGQLPPKGLLDRLAGTIHIHHLAPFMAQAHPGYRSYLWCTEQALCEFWASLYLAREIQSIPGLNWDSYPTWQLPENCIGQAVISCGSTPNAAMASLLAQTEHTRLTTAVDAILVIEGNYGLSIGDYVDLLNLLEAEIKCDVAPTGWVTPGYSGYGLKLLTFSPL